MSPCCFISFEHASPRRQTFVSTLFAPALSGNRVSSVSDRWRRLPSFRCLCPSHSCLFWSENEASPLPVANSPYRRIFGILTSADLIPVFAVAIRRRCSGLTRVQAWAGFYEWSVVSHAAHFNSPCYRCCPGERVSPIQLGTGVVARTKLNISSNGLRDFGSGFVLCVYSRKLSHNWIWPQGSGGFS